MDGDDPPRHDRIDCSKGRWVMEYYYIVGTDTAIRRSGRVVQQPVFDGPHTDESEAHTVAGQLIVAGNYEVISSPHKTRDAARQEYNHQLAVGGMGGAPVGAGGALVPRYKLKTDKRTPLAEAKYQQKVEKEQAWT